jgi:hypothetical protein
MFTCIIYIYIYTHPIYSVATGQMIDLFPDSTTRSSQESGKEARTAFCAMRPGGKVLDESKKEHEKWTFEHV